MKMQRNLVRWEAKLVAELPKDVPDHITRKFQHLVSRRAQKIATEMMSQVAGAWARTQKREREEIEHQEYVNKQRQARPVYVKALQRGELVPQPCQMCSSTLRIGGHHEDYAKPLEVVWLCQRHHALRHAEINRLKKSGAKVQPLSSAV